MCSGLFMCKAGAYIEIKESKLRGRRSISPNWVKDIKKLRKTKGSRDPVMLIFVSKFYRKESGYYKKTNETWPKNKLKDAIESTKKKIKELIDENEGKGVTILGCVEGEVVI